MHFIEAQQGTDAWYAARCGLITASCFSDAISVIGGLTEQQATYAKLIQAGHPQAYALAEAGYKAAPTSETLKRHLKGEVTTSPSDVAEAYAARTAFEIISGKPQGERMKVWVMERGHEMEAKCKPIYEARTKAFVSESGICVDGNGFGYSSDGLVDIDGLIEVKAPVDERKIMAMWATGDTSEYDHQMQGGMWITGRKWCDFLMYAPALESVGKDLYIKRIHRDDAFIDAMVGELSRFQLLVNSKVAILRALV